jgi:hypothetical protein
MGAKLDKFKQEWKEMEQKEREKMDAKKENKSEGKTTNTLMTISTLVQQAPVILLGLGIIIFLIYAVGYLLGFWAH